MWSQLQPKWEEWVQKILFREEWEDNVDGDKQCLCGSGCELFYLSILTS